jgi:RND family efflux transporter MFP subunit
MNKIVLSLVLISSMAFFSCKEKKPPPTPPAAVNLYTVKAEQVFYYDTYQATTVAISQVGLLPQVQGFITGIFFTEGSEVKKGQKLYEIDRRLYQQNYDAAVANLKVQQGNLVQAQQDADRYEYLNSQNAVAKQTLDHAVITLQNAKNQVEASEEAVKTAATNLTYSVITAPFDGTIGFSQVKIGNLVTVGQTVLNTISTVDPMAVDFLITEKQLAHFQELDKNSKELTDSLFTIVLPNNAIYPFSGKISVIDRAVDPQTGTMRIRLVFSNPDYALRAGMSCIVRVHNQDASPQLVIPAKAVVEQMGEYFVFIAKDTVMAKAVDSTQKTNADTAEAGPKLRAFQVKVVPGQTIGANMVIKSGLDKGDKIVADGVQTLHDGSAITISAKHAGAQDGSKGSSNKTDSSKSSQDKN